MVWRNYENLTIQPQITQDIKRRYSVTADILSYRQCPKQYGAFNVRKYEPALAVQLFYGTIIHQVLDRAHAHYKGYIGPQVAGSIPNDNDIERYFTEVENSLKARRIRAVAQVRDQALEIIKRFNNLEGPNLYPLVKDTECKLQADQDTYILHGNVDVIACSFDNHDEVEIWDYKGASKPSRGESLYDQYIYQMYVYAELYRRRTGNLPRRAVLYFLNELKGNPAPNTRPINATLIVDFNNQAIDRAMRNFGDTVNDIEQCRTSRIWPDPTLPPDEKTCDVCDLRWNCSYAENHGRVYPMPNP